MDLGEYQLVGLHSVLSCLRYDDALSSEIPNALFFKTRLRSTYKYFELKTRYRLLIFYDDRKFIS